MASLDALTVVSTWADADDSTLGRRFRETFADHWGAARLVTFSDVDILEADAEVGPWRKRENDAKTASRRDIHRGVMKWSWKVFALHAAMLEASGWLLWVDADVEFLHPPTREFLDIICPDDADVSYLGRPWAYASETGFVAYNVSIGRVRNLIAEMRRTYLSGAFRNLAEWGDAAVFDHCRERLGIHGNDLSSHCQPPDLHVWPKTVLRPFLQHNKGPARKRAAYG